MTGALFSSISGYRVANMATRCVLSPGFSGLALIKESPSQQLKGRLPFSKSAYNSLNSIFSTII